MARDRVEFVNPGDPDYVNPLALADNPPPSGKFRVNFGADGLRGAQIGDNNVQYGPGTQIGNRNTQRNTF